MELLWALLAIVILGVVHFNGAKSGERKERQASAEKLEKVEVEHADEILADRGRESRDTRISGALRRAADRLAK